ncbi:hypothetical protein [Streptomyces sp. NRRL B-1347]|uniref:hypothetical protein n=1 Tax=Streptomyces sp. NRRL B-1347 TaxID=1476877 RepID=UPI0004C48A5F|nr:hypothetical protein [Streptomyces sp. NRRL B-1347]
MHTESRRLFSGRGESEFDVPEDLSGRVLLAELWGGLLGKGFYVTGQKATKNSVRREKVGGSAMGKRKSHLFIPAEYGRLGITGGVHIVRTWNVALSEVTDAPRLGEVETAEASRVFSYSGGSRQADVTFSNRGCVTLFDLEGKEKGVLISHDDKFHGTITLPRKPGLIVVSAARAGWGWGDVGRWEVKLRG